MATQQPRVRIRLRGQTHEFPVPPEAFSILDAGLDAGYDLPYSCCAGICTSCVARCLHGAVRPRAIPGDTPGAEDDVLSAEEQAAGYVLCCQVLPEAAFTELSFDEPLDNASYTPDSALT